MRKPWSSSFSSWSSWSSSSISRQASSYCSSLFCNPVTVSFQPGYSLDSVALTVLLMWPGVESFCGLISICLNLFCPHWATDRVTSSTDCAALFRVCCISSRLGWITCAQGYGIYRSVHNYRSKVNWQKQSVLKPQYTWTKVICLRVLWSSWCFSVFTVLGLIVRVRSYALPKVF